MADKENELQAAKKRIKMLEAMLEGEPPAAEPVPHTVDVKVEQQQENNKGDNDEESKEDKQDDKEDLFEARKCISDSDDDVLSSTSTSLGIGEVNEYSDSDNEPQARCWKSRSKSRSARRPSSSRSQSRRAGELNTIVPESEFLDIHRIDVDKVISLQNHYTGCNIPHYLVHAFDEGDETNFTPLEPPTTTNPNEPLLPVCATVQHFTNRSRKKDGSIIKYNIYTAERTDPSALYDVGTTIFNKEGIMIGKLSCIFGQVSSPMYVVQESRFEVEDEELDEEPMSDYLPPLTGLFTKESQAVIIHRAPPGSQPNKMEEDVVKRYHIPGCDASHLDDEELPVEKQEFSDDDKEREAKAEKKKRKRETAEQTRMGLLDMMSDDESSESSEEEYKFNEDGEIVEVIQKPCKSKKRTKPATGTREAVRTLIPKLNTTSTQRGSGMPIPPPPRSLRGDPKRIYVSDIPLGVTWHQLAAIMGASYGTVEEATVVHKKDKKSGGMREKQYGFVTFQNETSARQAIFVGKIFTPDGQQMRISTSRPERIPKPKVSFEKPKERQPVLPPRLSIEPDANAQGDDAEPLPNIVDDPEEIEL
eukprot:TRINITY_DN9630_c0_g1_i1.p1 TRINITY_DN9630_c0_g1~~TRINITY_DN9630_c0_g1_i1.p1  ORF type:complete len:589 (+),score=151.90 TRINITY_DN9630_c0_g1_i1:94-1860(+)